jgi:hypothetical protein
VEKMEKYPYKVEDQEGNEFVFAGIENGHPLYRGNGGSKHIFDIEHYKVIQNGNRIQQKKKNRSNLP